MELTLFDVSFYNYYVYSKNEENLTQIYDKIHVYTGRQLKFTKDSCRELNGKLQNPKYRQYKDKILAILNKRKSKKIN